MFPLLEPREVLAHLNSQSVCGLFSDKTRDYRRRLIQTIYLQRKKIVQENPRCSAPLKHFIEIGQVGDLQHGAVLAELLQRTEERPESLKEVVFYFPPPRVHLILLKRAPCVVIVTSPALLHKTDGFKKTKF